MDDIDKAMIVLLLPAYSSWVEGQERGIEFEDGMFRAITFDADGNLIKTPIGETVDVLLGWLSQQNSKRAKATLARLRRENLITGREVTITYHREDGSTFTIGGSDNGQVS